MTISRIFLIGPRGSGKSTLAPLLASALGWSWLDLDSEIETQQNQTVRAIFESAGESEFRRLESAMLHSLTNRDRCVIATGGGIVEAPDNRAFLQQHGLVIWLDADPISLHNRIEADPRSRQQRPALIAGGLSEVETLKTRRDPWYAHCHNHRFDTGSRTPNEIITAIVATTHR